MTKPAPSPREYQLVLEFHGDDLASFDRVIALASELESKLASGDVDGHDVGGGIVNIFIDTPSPKLCFEEAMRIIKGREPQPAAAGFRDFTEDEYERLWPSSDPTPFKLK